MSLSKCINLRQVVRKYSLNEMNHENMRKDKKRSKITNQMIPCFDMENQQTPIKKSNEKKFLRRYDKNLSSPLGLVSELKNQRIKEFYRKINGNLSASNEHSSEDRDRIYFKSYEISKSPFSYSKYSKKLERNVANISGSEVDLLKYFGKKLIKGITYSMKVNKDMEYYFKENMKQFKKTLKDPNNTNNLNSNISLIIRL
jgi:hypothetical protein